MAPENTKTSNINLTSMEIGKLDNAFKNPEFRKLLVEYSREINDPENRARYEAEIKQLESERSGTECIFLHPQPGYVIKTWGSVNAQNPEKIFINICSDENVAKPESKRAVDPCGGVKKGVQWSIPYSLTKARKDIDKAGLSCLVFDVIFHPNALALAERSLAMKGLLNDTALEAVEKSGDQVKVDRKKVRFPKLKFKGAFHPTVIRKTPDEKKEKEEDAKANVEASAGEVKSSSPPTPSPVMETNVKEPKYNVKYRHTSNLEDAAVYQGGRQLIHDPLRPSEIVVEVFLPEMTSAKTVDLDVEEKRMTLESKEPAEYHLVVDFAYPVDEEKGSAKFDRSTKKLLITLPVKSVAINRLTSTDSGIDIEFDDAGVVDIVKEDTAYRTSTESDNECDLNDVSSNNNEDDNNKLEANSGSEDDQHLLFPTYTCNVYDELMVLKLDVKNVDEESLTKSNLESSEGSGFSLRFTTIGSGMVPLKYGFDMVFLFREDEPGYSLDDLEVEIWDNNIIVQMALPMADCSAYKVGNSLTNMKEHTLPQLRAFKQKRKQLMRSISTPEKYCSFASQPPTSQQEENDNIDSEKERHSSGDSAISSSPPTSAIKNDVTPISTVTKGQISGPRMTETVPTRGILKTNCNRGRSFSESNATDRSRLMESASMVSVGSSIAEEQEDEDSCFMNGNGGSGSSRKSVRFSEVVHRQVFRSNSSILGQKMKNTKKAEQKKRRAIERRASEGDAEHFSSSSVEDAIHKTGSWMNVRYGGGDNDDDDDDDDDSHTDSGMASSMEETSQIPKQKKSLKQSGVVKSGTRKGKEQQPKASQQQQQQSQTKKKLNSGQFLKEANPDLIFDLDF